MEQFKATVCYDEEIEDWVLWFLEESGLRRKRHRSPKNQRKFEKRAKKCWLKQQKQQKSINNKQHGAL